MKTERIKVSSIIQDIDKISHVGKLLTNGAVVAIPTETVYGLAANALDEKAVARIFEAKGRPQDNPLIVHISEVYDMEKLCLEIPEAAYQLANAFWPGPLTMIMKKKEVVPNIVTAGLDTVGIRCPRGRFARAIIHAAGVPLAAPSANASGRPSPTRVEHVIEDMDGKIEAIVDGGPCSVGVESTVIDLTGERPTLLRPGGITLGQLKKALGDVAVDPAVTELISEDTPVRAPGMKYRHYAPKAPVVIVNGRADAAVQYIKHDAQGRKAALLCFAEEADIFSSLGMHIEIYGRQAAPEELARGLFDALRRFDALDLDVIYAREPENGEGIELAVVNRLEKAAGFTRVSV